MGRRFRIWWVILGILVIGTCVTKMTKDFVTKHGMETTAPVLLASEHVLAGTAAYDGDMPIEEEQYDEAAIEDIPVFDMEAEETEQETVPSAVESIKSPLDPFVESKAVRVPMERGQTVYSREELQSRFDKTEETVSGLWSNIAANSEEAVFAAAEQERMLWIYELKLVTEAVQRNMSKEENEAFKILEAEWVKERDFYAAQKSAGGQSKNGQAAEYARAVAEKTKERCYWMLTQYESILNRRNGQ